MEFKKICDAFEKYNEKCDERNPIVNARAYIIEKYGFDKEKLTGLKVLAMDNDYGYYSSMMLGIYALFVSIVSLVQKNWWTMIVSLVAIIIFFRPQIVFYFRFKNVRKWRNCILVVTEQLIEDCEKQGEQDK